jgi:hypothetical protein
MLVHGCASASDALVRAGVTSPPCAGHRGPAWHLRVPPAGAGFAFSDEDALELLTEWNAAWTMPARTADDRRSGSFAQGEQELGLRTHSEAWHTSIGATAPRQDREVRPLRAASGARVRRPARQNCVSLSNDNRYNGHRATARRANERKGVPSHGSNEATTVWKRLSAETRKGVGDPLAGGGNCSRRHEEEGAAV